MRGPFRQVLLLLLDYHAKRQRTTTKSLKSLTNLQRASLFVSVVCDVCNRLRQRQIRLIQDCQQNDWPLLQVALIWRVQLSSDRFVPSFLVEQFVKSKLNCSLILFSKIRFTFFSKLSWWNWAKKMSGWWHPWLTKLMWNVKITKSNNNWRSSRPRIRHNYCNRRFRFVPVNFYCHDIYNWWSLNIEIFLSFKEDKSSNSKHIDSETTTTISISTVSKHKSNQSNHKAISNLTNG